MKLGMAKDQRKIKNLLVSPGLRQNYYLHVFAGGVAFLGIIMYYVVQLLSEVRTAVSTLPDFQMANLVQDHLLTIALLFFVSFFAFVAFTVYYMIILGHRVGGAVVAILAYIEELKKGNYDAKRNLRKNDELVPIMQGLRELADSLNKRK
ncbi:MAG: hypothetical protein AB7F86_16940 [Bdellovibrionales bacterium]